MSEDDPYRWLEGVTSPDALEFVRERSDATLAEAESDGRFRTFEAEAREILDASDRIPWVRMRGGFAYNFWRDADHPRGVWRRMSLSRFVTTADALAPDDWELLLDVDALAAAEGENWVYAGTSVHRPDDTRALCSLSRGGADAVVVREFDLEARGFVAPADGGFVLPEAKTSATWVDADTIAVVSALGEGHATESGYGRTVRLLRRGAALEGAPVVFEVEPGDVAAGFSVDAATGRALAFRAVDFHNARVSYRPPGEAARPDAEGWRALPTPPDCRLASEGEWLFLLPRTDVEVGGVTVPAGGVAAVAWDSVDAAFPATGASGVGADDAGENAACATGTDNAALTAAELPAPTVLFAPGPDQALEDVTFTRSGAIVEVLENVESRLVRFTAPAAPTAVWTESEISATEAHGVASVVTTDPLTSDDALLAVSSPVDPPALVLLEADDSLRRIASTPARFDASTVVVERFFARSDDGTSVPYFVMRRSDLDGPRPTVLYGYGGFEIAQKPSYAALRGKLWVERGGTYVVAGIRGGGEYGPAWHAAALREKRPRAFEDFAAVARDLVARRLTTRAQLGTYGGSNGGLLMGVMLTRYPELFGAVAIAVPLLDMRRYHRLLAGASWVAEYGDPDSADWEFLAPYSPLHNVRSTDAVRYPPALLTTSTRDDRVHPGHARKMVAALEAAGQDVRYFENIEGGHAGASDNAQEARKSALLYWFFAEQLGLLG